MVLIVWYIGVHIHLHICIAVVNMTVTSLGIQVPCFLQGSSSHHELHHWKHTQVVSLFLIQKFVCAVPIRSKRLKTNIYYSRSPDLACWGVSALVGVLFFADSIPRLHRDFFQKIPIVGPAYDKSVPASDAPF